MKRGPDAGRGHARACAAGGCCDDWFAGELPGPVESDWSSEPSGRYRAGRRSHQHHPCGSGTV